MEVTLGGDRLGSGNKQKIEMHNYQMSSFNQEQDFKSTLAPGILYPFCKLVGTNHGTFDIDLDAFVRTLPTRGPLLGSYKLQIDLFTVPMRLYQAILHNNPQKIGMKMNQVYLPKLQLEHYYVDNEAEPVPEVKGSNKYNQQISDSSLLKYLGMSGIGTCTNGDKAVGRKINAIPVLAYYDIFKCYYSNKQEEKAYVIIPGEPVGTSIIEEAWRGAWDYPSYPDAYRGENYNPYKGEDFNVSEANLSNNWQWYFGMIVKLPEQTTIEDFIDNTRFTGAQEIYLDDTMLNVGKYQIGREEENKWQLTISVIAAERGNFQQAMDGNFNIVCEIESHETTSNIKLQPFALQNIDDMRNAILSKNNFGDEFGIKEYDGDWTTSSGSDRTGYPYSALTRHFENMQSFNQYELNGLVVKTYQSDLFNNWLDSEWIDGEEGIAALTAISTQDGKFTIDSFVFAEKLYDIYNRIATGGGTYEDWQEACYGEGAVRKAETPMYIGGMAAEIMFEEVISSAETKVDGDRQALGSLGGKGVLANQKGGRNIHVKCEEPSYVMGIASITPRICYSQGNDWDLTELDSMDDLHKPGLDGIGFQDLIVEQMAWWDTKCSADPSEGVISRNAAGKQTAWINYQTAVDKCFADFAKQDGYAFMVLNRNYEMEGDPAQGTATVKDITTYIDPSKFNYAFAYDELAAQNFWVQIHSNVVSRRKMGAQQIPNL